MAKYSLARQLTGKKVITNEGEEFGKLVDVNINEITGKIEELVVDPSPDKANLEGLKDEEGFILCPYDSVLAVGDFIIVEKRSLGGQS
ncbi:MAG: PRC-barrel domain-containing protein [Candidatus Micrarchaeota archaeon]